MQSAQCQNQVEIEQQNNQAINNAGVVQNPTSSGAQSLQKREKQRPETWNKIEQQIFFNALRQNGKNFESITQYFNARQKRYKMDEMGPTSGVQRSKEQIRHFYYRTWHKIIKYIEIPKNLGSNSTNNENSKEASDKTGQNSSYCINVSNCSLRDIQVKCLIAFNVLMNNKSYCWNKKTAVKLVELVNQGCTTVREKGKLARLRMPICKVSSKSIQNTESNTSNQIPQTLSVNLEPNSDAAFCKVHRLAQNPFLSIRIQPQQAIKFLIDFLENKWKVQKNTTVEKSQPDEQISSKNGASSKSDLSNEFDENSSEQLKSKANTETSNLGERIILFPHESHQLVNIDLASSEGEMARGYEYEPLVAEANQQKTSTDFSDITINCNDPLGIDDCAMVPEDIATSNVKQNQNKNANPTSSTTPNSSNNQAQKQAEFSIDIIKSGLTWSNASISISNGTSKEKKELTFSQLYLALNRPNFVKLKYDWIISSSGAGELDQCDSSGQSSNNLSSLSSQFQLSHHQSQKQQQFYFDAVASTASSFLNEMLKTKTDAANNQAMSSSNTASNEKSTNLSNANSTPSGSPTSQSSSSAHFKIPIRPASAQVTHQNSPNSQRSIAFLQPMSASNQGAIIPLDTVLARISEEQANKTKLILSDLGSKRRSRQRKPVMVVNSGHSPRAMLPKLNIMNALNSAPESIINDSAVAQNIVFSGPVAAVARQVFNNNEQGGVIQQQQQQQSTKQPMQQMPPSIQMLQDESSSMQESYSNLLPKILPTSITINEESNQSKLQQKANDSHVVLIEGSGPEVINKNMNGEETSNTLTDISLLDMSINNADSLFGSAVKMSCERFQQQPNEIVLRTINQKSLNFSTELRKVVTSFDNILNTETASNCFSPSESSKIIKGFTNLLNENSLNNVVNSAPIEKNVQQDQQQQQMVLGLTNQQQNPTNSQFNSNPTTSLVHKKSDIMIEWTDSMNDVSLTGCFLNDVQSPEKTNKNVALINENSRDSIFFNMDTITDILPQGVNRFDDSILTNANTIENIHGQSKT